LGKLKVMTENSSYDFIIDNIRFSYSSVSSFETCKYGYKLNYIDKLPRKQNFFGEYGLLVHDCFEKFFGGDLEVFELSQYYESKYKEIVKTSPPQFLYKYRLEDRYKLQGLKFFDSFSFDKGKYEALIIEDKIDFEIGDIKLVAKPDLVLKEKETGKIIQYDYKTSTPFRIDKKTGAEIKDTKKLEGYYKQMFIYSYALRNKRNMPLDETIILFTRLNREVKLPWTLEDEIKAVNWMVDIIENIRKEEEFAYDNSSKFFCNFLCGVRESCKYR